MRRLLPSRMRICSPCRAVGPRRSRIAKARFFDRNPNWSCCTSPSRTKRRLCRRPRPGIVSRARRQAAAGNQLFQQPGRAGHRRSADRCQRQHGAESHMVIAASMAFSKAMNPQDEFFVLGFNEHIHTPLPPRKPFTNSEPTLRVALVQAIKARGQTAIYNAVDAGARLRAEGRIRAPGAHRPERWRRQCQQHNSRAGARERAGIECRHLHDCARRSDGSRGRSRVL